MSGWEGLFSWGLAVVIWLQVNLPGLTWPMVAVSAMGTEVFFLLLLPFLYWCVNPRLATRLGVAISLSASLMVTLKFLFHAPRPFWISDEVHPAQPESSYGLPSGHAQNAAVFWGLWAQQTSGWERGLAISLIFLIGFSRLQLGVHFPWDVLAGWAVGGIILMAFLRWEKPLTRAWRSRSLPGQVLLALLVSLMLVALPLLAGLALPPEDPPGWAILAARAFPENPTVYHPRDLGGVVGLAGVLFGFLTGWTLLQRQGGFEVAGCFRRKTLRVLLGMAVAGGGYLAVQVFLPGGAAVPLLVGRYLALAAVGLWISWGAPLVFRRLRL
ncbi:MAG: phosphatase PAP2 family protein [Coprothermobacterota bacterium]|nr:phosphatase PAP2 family protein [Coprothermobacterota bacterium]